MTDTEAFHRIDEAIEDFKLHEGLHKDIKVSKKSNKGWLVFKWRQISWTNDDVHSIIEVYPNI